MINMTFSVLGKAVPKMNVFMISFPVRIVVGMCLLLVVVGLITQYFHSYIEYIPKRMIEFLMY